MSLAVLVGGHVVTLPGVQAQVGETPTALVAEQAVGVLVEQAVPPVTIRVADVHSSENAMHIGG